MKEKIVKKISGCRECDSLQYIPMDGIAVCTDHHGIRFDPKKGIPDFCPLEDVVPRTAGEGS